jgi:hypothetical protein
MSVREQLAWVWLATMLVTYTIYFSAISLLHGQELSLWTELALFGTTVAAQLLVLGLWSLSLLLRKRDARKVDERDRAIYHRSATAGYHVLIIGMCFVGCVLPFYKTGWDIVHAAIFSIVVAELVRQVLIVLWYRRGWHA